MALQDAFYMTNGQDNKESGFWTFVHLHLISWNF